MTACSSATGCAEGSSPRNSFSGVFLGPAGLLYVIIGANRVYDHKNMVRTPDFKDRLAASATWKAQIERTRAIAEDPTRLRRIEARSEIIAARNIRIAERERESD